ncbi:MAG: hypothetical protein U9R25_18685, partial [Chloroflexota bacterium]|nr:hypothetical protein [Chloroflexota bacterium]
MSDIKDIAESSARQVSPPDWPATSHRAKIALKEEIPSLMLAGEKIPLSLQITNLSDRTWQPDGPDGVELVTRIEPQEPELLTPPEQRWPLSQPLQPDETLSWNRSSNAPRTGGTYLMVWDMARAGDDGLFSEHLGRPPDSARFVIVDMDTVQTILPGLFKRPEDEIIQWLAMVARILPDEPDTALQQSLLNDGLIKGLFQSHLGVRREALYGLHDQYQDHIVASIDSEIERALKHPDNDLEPVLNLSTHPQVKAEARIWLQTLIAQVHPGRLEAHIVEEMARLFADGKFERALALAQSIPDQDIRVTVLLSWAESMAEDDTENQTAQVISLVLDEAASLSEPRKSDIGLRAVGILLSAGELERALTVARSIDDPARRVQALAATETGGGGDTETEG